MLNFACPVKSAFIFNRGSSSRQAIRLRRINHPDEIGTGIYMLSILRIALKVSAYASLRVTSCKMLSLLTNPAHRGHRNWAKGGVLQRSQGMISGRFSCGMLDNCNDQMRGSRYREIRRKFFKKTIRRSAPRN